MTRAAALLRAVNVGGNRKVPMSELAALLHEAGLTSVRTVLNSGNAVFDASTDDLDALDALELELTDRVSVRFGFAVPVLVRSAARLDALLAANPFADAPAGQVHVAFNRSPIDTAGVAPHPRERFGTVGSDVFLLLPDGVAHAVLPKALRLDRAPATLRNLQTVTKLAQLARSS